MQHSRGEIRLEELPPHATSLINTEYYNGYGLQIKGENYLPAVDAETACIENGRVIIETSFRF